ncbi:coiled-coil domain-containing protein 115 [Toxorhynchites rutilus septentrionalis]|uniref:coiled-coil domain-containing protein 115 n=1 Tax=Toxorhynchites rutilus septentrionalis TaxID=329112 RepID=UPI00247A3BAB|nr:coiled-coil domain-containing protein 115 [Toxorhynchites rutilus septentrionalis]
MESRDDICLLMDKLMIQSLELIEQEVKLKTNIETITNDGQLDLAYTRYTKGPNSASAVQLPTEDYKEFKALCSVEETRDELGDVKLNLTKHEVNHESGYINPLRWFGILIPETLQKARDKFSRSLEYVVECANVQIELRNLLLCYEQLNKLKNDM